MSGIQDLVMALRGHPNFQRDGAVEATHVDVGEQPCKIAWDELLQNGDDLTEMAGLPAMGHSDPQYGTVIVLRPNEGGWHVRYAGDRVNLGPSPEQEDPNRDPVFQHHTPDELKEAIQEMIGDDVGSQESFRDLIEETYQGQRKETEEHNTKHSARRVINGRTSDEVMTAAMQKYVV